LRDQTDSSVEVILREALGKLSAARRDEAMDGHRKGTKARAWKISAAAVSVTDPVTATKTVPATRLFIKNLPISQANSEGRLLAKQHMPPGFSS
jgi:hypothetical protein